MEPSERYKLPDENAEAVRKLSLQGSVALQRGITQKLREFFKKNINWF